MIAINLHRYRESRRRSNIVRLPPAGSPSPPKHRSPARTTSASQRTVTSPTRTSSSQLRTVPSPTRTLPSPLKSLDNYEIRDEIVIKSDPSEDNISEHSLLSIHHKSTSKLKTISLTSSQDSSLVGRKQ